MASGNCGHSSFIRSKRSMCDGLLFLDRQTIEKIVGFFVADKSSDESTYAAIRLTCRKLRTCADAHHVWKDIPLVYPNGSIRLQSFLQQKKPDRAGTEGFCIRVVSKATGSLYALKEARPFPENEGVPYFLVREISTLRALVHPNVAPLLGVTVKKQTLYMLFPYVQHSLLDVLTFRPDRAPRQPAPLPRKLAMPLIMQLVDALAYCHSKGVLHRNVKPKHILIQMQEPHDEDNEEFNLQGAHLYLSDFALMRSVSKPKKQVTAEMTSLWYRPPEVLLGSRTYTEAVDVWSLGCVVAEMLLGSPLFTGMSQVDQLFKIFSKLGTPTAASWPAFTSQPYFSDCMFPEWDVSGSSELSLAPFFPSISSSELDLLERCLRCCPEKRSTAVQLLVHPAFLPYRMKEVVKTAITNDGRENTAGSGIVDGSLWWRMREAKTSLPTHKVKRYVEERTLPWEQVLSMQARELKIRSEHFYGYRHMVAYRCSGYSSVVRYLVDLHLQPASSCSDRSLYFAVSIFSRYLDVLVQQHCEREKQKQQYGVLNLLCLCQIMGATSCDHYPLSSSIAPEFVTANNFDVGDCNHTYGGRVAVSNPLLALGISCLHLASKMEDVSFLDAAKVLQLSQQIADELQQLQHLNSVSRTNGMAVGTAIRMECAAEHSKDENEEEEDDEMELTEEGRLHAACAQLCAEDILRSEQRVLQALCFDICCPTVQDFLGYFSEECYRLLSMTLGPFQSRSTRDGLSNCCSLFPVLVIKELLAEDMEGEGAVTSPLQNALGEDSVLFPHLPFLEELADHLCWSTLLSTDLNKKFAPSLQAAAIVTLCVNLLMSLTPSTSCEVDAPVPAACESPFCHPVLPALQRAVFCWSGYSPRQLQDCQIALCAAMGDFPCLSTATFSVPAYGLHAVSLSLGDIISHVDSRTLKKATSGTVLEVRDIINSLLLS